MRARFLTILTSLALSALALTPLLLSGCANQATLQTVNDASGLFHILAPPRWQAKAEPGLLVLFAGNELPKTDDEAFERLSIGIFTAEGERETPLDAQLVEMLEARAADRGWSDAKIGAPSPVQVGKRSGYAVSVKAKDSRSREFAGRAALVRTSGSEVLVFAVSPANQWERDAEKVEKVFADWYWHYPAASLETTAP